MNTKPKILFYCQHSMGIGHLTRSFAICRALADVAEVVFLSGGEIPVQWADRSNAFRIVELPPLFMDAKGTLQSSEAGITLQEAKAQRLKIINNTVSAFKPNVIVIEMYPFGRKKFAEEISGMIAQAKQHNPKTFVTCSVRDILVDDRRDQERHDERAVRFINDQMDFVLVHSDSDLVHLRDTFALTHKLEVPVYHTGFVAQTDSSSQASTQGRWPARRVVVSAGGGRVGGRLLEICVSSQQAIRERFGLDMLLLTGPFLDKPTRQYLGEAALRQPGLVVKTFVRELAREMQQSMLSISQCGYNTVIDILQSGVPAIVVPYSQERENEQSKRAALLQERQRLISISEPELTRSNLLAAIESMELRLRHPNKANLDGAHTTTRLILQALGG